MMRFRSHLDERPGRREQVCYESTVTVRSQAYEGVEFTVVRLSLGRRLELARRVLELSKRLEFHTAGSSAEDKIEANILSCEIDELYLRWGLVRIAGLKIDGVEATPESIVENGPESLTREIVNKIKTQCGLTEDERKN